MAHQVVWTKAVLDAFIREANLTEYEADVMRTRVAGMTVVQQSFYFNRSVSSINQTIKLLKLKYDFAQQHSSILKPRKRCADELYMDTH